MKINGLKHLNSNFYDSIMIRNKANEIQVDVKTEDKIKTLKSSYSFFDRIKNLSDKEKVNEIIRYYLRYSNICGISNDYLSHYDGLFSVIEGTRNLFLQINKGQADDTIFDEIISKYEQDRMKYMNESTISNIAITTSIGSSSNYGYYKNECNNDEYIYLHLRGTVNNDLVEFEKKFLFDFINLKISEVDEKIEAFTQDYTDMYWHYYKRGFEDFAGCYIKCSKFTIRLDRILYNMIIPLIYNHNLRLKENKKLQLTFDDYIS